MQEQYQKPELRLVGKADDVVFGSLGVGEDIFDEFMAINAEFQVDQEVPHMQL